MKAYVAIIDYGMGNLFSIAKACQYVGLDAVVTSRKEEIDEACGIILPGVGAFGDAMENLRKLGLIQPLKAALDASKPFLGICLGMQLLMSESTEFGIHKGLDAIKGTVVRFPVLDPGNNRIKIPHVGWSRICFDGAASSRAAIFKNTENGAYMYFAHSYFVNPDSSLDMQVTTDYCGIRYCSGFVHRNIHAFQFHPEKSGLGGIELYRNFKEIVL